MRFLVPRSWSARRPTGRSAMLSLSTFP
jgi:hypothetical protein